MSQHEFNEEDLASVVQQAMLGLEQDLFANEESHVDAQLSGEGSVDNQNNNNQNGNPNDSNTAANQSNHEVDDIEREIQRQIEEQLAQDNTNHVADANTDSPLIGYHGDNSQAHTSNDEDDFAKEVERQLQAQLDNEIENHKEQATRESSSAVLQDKEQEPKDDFDLDEHIRQQLNAQLDSSNDISNKDGEISHQDYEQELQRQIMDALETESTPSNPETKAQSSAGEPVSKAVEPNSPQPRQSPTATVEQQSKNVDSISDDMNFNDFEKDLQKQIMEAFNANNESSKSMKNQSDIALDAETSQKSQSEEAKDVVIAENDFELQLQNQIMNAFNAVNSTNDEIQKDKKNDSKEDSSNDDYEQELQNQILQAFNDHKHVSSLTQSPPEGLTKSNTATTAASKKQTQNLSDLDVDFGGSSLKDALAELVQNVVDAQSEVDPQSQSTILPQSEAQAQLQLQLQQQVQLQQQLHHLQQLQLQQQQVLQLQQQQQQAPKDALKQQTQDEEDIDMNQIMQNALAMAVEDPTALLQSLNMSEMNDSSVVGNNVLGQILQQGNLDLSQQLSAKTEKPKRKQTKPREKKPPKEKKPRAPRKTPAKKKKEKPAVSQIPIFQQGTPYPPITLHNLPQSLQQQAQSLHLATGPNIHVGGASASTPVPINQQPIAVPPVLQQQVAQLQQQQQQKLLLQLQQKQQSSSQQVTKKLDHVSSLPIIPLVPITKPKPVEQEPTASPSPGSSSDLNLLQQVKPLEPVVDLEKKTPLLLSKDASIDLANTQKKKASLSIAETLALSRSSMSSGKFSSKLNDKRDEDMIGKSHDQAQDNGPLAPASPGAFQSSDSSQQKNETSSSSVSLLADSKASSRANSSALSENTTLQTLPLQNRSPSTTSLLPLAPGAQGNALLNNIGTLLPNLPTNLTSLISNAITNAFNSHTIATSTLNFGDRQQRDFPKSLKKKPYDKDETPEQQKERVRLENRERKKRWRDANRLKNQNNDLRARLKKRAIQLFGPDESNEKTAWIDAEFEKRKQRRIIRAANLEDLTNVINETMTKLDISSLNQESLSSLVTQIVTNALNNSQTVHPPSDGTSSSPSIVNINGNNVLAGTGANTGLSPAVGSTTSGLLDQNLINSMASSSTSSQLDDGADTSDLLMNQEVFNSITKDLVENVLELSKDYNKVGEDLSRFNSVPIQNQSELSQLQKTNGSVPFTTQPQVPLLTVPQFKTPVIPLTKETQVSTPKLIPLITPQSKPITATSNLSVPATAPKPVLPLKRKSEALSGFAFKKAKIPLIPLTRFNDDPIELKANNPQERSKVTSSEPRSVAKSITPPVSQTVVVPTAATTGSTKVSSTIAKISPPAATTNTSSSSSSTTTTTTTTATSSTSTSANVPQIPKSKPLVRTSSPIQPPSMARPIKMPAFRKPEPPVGGSTSTSTPTTKSNNDIPNDPKKPTSSNSPTPLSSSQINITKPGLVKAEKKNTLQRPKFGIRKPGAFAGPGLRKPGAFQRPPEKKSKA